MSMNSRFLTMLLGGVVCSWAWLASAQEQAGECLQVARLIDDLGSEHYQRRADANARLQQIGQQAQPQLTEALAADDPEIRLRAAHLLRRLQVANIWDAAESFYSSQELPLSQIVPDIARRSGNVVLLGEGYGGYRDKPIRLGTKKLSFWAAMDEICRQSGNYLRPQNSPGQASVVLASGEPGKNPLAYSGPVRAQLLYARRLFSEQLDYTQSQSVVSHGFELAVQMMWEPRLQVIAYRALPELELAQADDGQLLTAVRPGRKAWNVARPGIRQVNAKLQLHPPRVSSKRLEELRLRWGVVAVGDMATLEIPRLKPGERYHQDGIEIFVDRVEKASHMNQVVTVYVVRDLVAPQPLEVLLHENRLELIDQHGQPYAVRRRSPVLDGPGVRLTIAFQAPSANSRPTALRITYPQIRSTRNVAITFRDVKLPVVAFD